MKKKIIQLCIIIILFFDAFFSIINNLPECFKWWDVLLELLLLIFFTVEFYKKIHNKSEEINKNFYGCYILLLCIIFIGLLGDLVFNYYSSIFAIIRDILSFLKFPLTFLLLKNLKLDDKISDVLDEEFYNILKWIVCIILILGIISLFFNIGLSMDEFRHGIRPYKFLFSHSTFLVMNMVFILALFEYKRDSIKNVNIFELMITIIIFLSMRTKAIAFIAVFFLIKFFSGFLEKHKKISLVIIFLVLFITAYSKLALYASFSYSTREVLYKGCLTIITKCFPIGSGFATYASHISGRYISKVYDFIDISYVFRMGYLAQLGDVGYPYYIGQFGILGCICLIILTKKIIDICLLNNENKMPTYILLLYILIGLTTESTVLNFGTEIAIILAIVSSKNVKET